MTPRPRAGAGRSPVSLEPDEDLFPDANACVAYACAPSRPVTEDRFRLLGRFVPLLDAAGRGELFAVFDGVSTSRKGAIAAQAMCDALPRWYRESEWFPPTAESLNRLILEANDSVRCLGIDPDSGLPLGACVGTVGR